MPHRRPLTPLSISRDTNNGRRLRRPRHFSLVGPVMVESAHLFTSLADHHRPTCQINIIGPRYKHRPPTVSLLLVSAAVFAATARLARWSPRAGAVARAVLGITVLSISVILSFIAFSAEGTSIPSSLLCNAYSSQASDSAAFAIDYRLFATYVFCLSSCYTRLLG
jgi:hypothetical protein